MTKLTYKDVPKEWQKQVRDRAIEEGVDEDSIIRYGLNYPFKKVKEDEDEKADEKADRVDAKADRKEQKAEMKSQIKLLQSILKELKKKP